MKFKAAIKVGKDSCRCLENNVSSRWMHLNMTFQTKLKDLVEIHAIKFSSLQLSMVKQFMKMVKWLRRFVL